MQCTGQSSACSQSPEVWWLRFLAHSLLVKHALSHRWVTVFCLLDFLKCSHQGLLLLVTSIVLHFIALPFWTPNSTFFAISSVSRGILESLQDQRSTVVALLIFWSLLGLLSLAVIPIYHWQQWNVTTRTRKLFHVAVLAVYTSGLAFSPLLLALASIGATLALVGLEMIRVSRVVPDVSTILTTSLQPFLDSKEGGNLILTHIYLLVGASWPLWLAPALNPPSLPLYAGPRC